MKNLVKVLGIGSPFGDDQLAWRTVDLLRQNPAIQRYIPSRIVIEKHDRPGLRLLDLMQEASAVFLIDAIKTNAAVGTVHRLKNQEIEGEGNRLSTHNIGVAEALHLGRVLGDLPHDIIFYGVEISDITLDFQISTVINHAILEVAQQLTKELVTRCRESA